MAWWNITDKGLLRFGQDFKKISRTLQSLSLRLYRCDEITDVGIKNLCQDFKALKCLRDIRLDFSGCSKITDQGIIIWVFVWKAVSH